MPVTSEVVRLLMIRPSVSSSSISVLFLLSPEYKCRVFILITRRLAFKPSHRYRPSSSLFLLLLALYARVETGSSFDCLLPKRTSMIQTRVSLNATDPFRVKLGWLVIEEIHCRSQRSQELAFAERS